jgi:hypothetical protein
MPDAQDHHTVGLDPVADDVGTGERGLAQLGAGDRTAAIGKLARLLPIWMIRAAKSRAA